MGLGAAAELFNPSCYPLNPRSTERGGGWARDCIAS